MDGESRRKPVKVLLLLHDLALSGATMGILNLFEQIRDDIDVHILAPEAGPLLPRCKQLGPVTLVGPTHGLLSRADKFRRMLHLPAARRQTMSWGPDIIYVNSISSLYLLQMLQLQANAPVVLHLHELEAVTQFLLRGNTHLLTDLPTSYIAVSTAVVQMLCRDYNIEESRITTIPEAIPDSYVNSVRRTEPKNTGRIVVGGSGWTGARKGIDLWLLMAAEIVKQLGPDAVRFQWIGARDNFEAYLYASIPEKLSISECVEFVPVTGDPASYFSEFNVFAMTSWEDPCPLVVLENMAIGVPVVCFAGSGGAPEQVGDAGIVVPEFSPKKMADAIISLVSDEARLRALGIAAAQRFQNCYSVSVVAPAVLDQLLKLSPPLPLQVKV